MDLFFNIIWSFITSPFTFAVLLPLFITIFIVVTKVSSLNRSASLEDAALGIDFAFTSLVVFVVESVNALSKNSNYSNQLLKGLVVCPIIFFLLLFLIIFLVKQFGISEVRNEETTPSNERDGGVDHTLNYLGFVIQWIFGIICLTFVIGFYKKFGGM